MRNYRTFEEVTTEYYTEHPEKIEGFLQTGFEEFAKDGDAAALLIQLRIVARARGMTTVAEDVGITRRGLQKALSGDGNPRFDTITAIMRSMGYSLVPQKLERATLVCQTMNH